MYNKPILFLTSIMLATAACSSKTNKTRNESADQALKPTIISDQVGYDTDDPAIWINPADATKSLVLGTDKASDGGLYAFDLEGRIVHKISGMKRPNNVDIAYGLKLNGKATDIAVVTERESGNIRIYSLPGLQPIDNGGIPVFSGEAEHFPMGIALYTRPADSAVFAVVGRKSGPADGYLWQYRLTDDGTGNIQATVVRKFGKYSGKKEIESIAVDNELGYIYYSDEQYGIHKYHASPDKGNEELALFGQKDFLEDIEGISIYKHADGTGYLLVSDQQANRFNVYPREGSPQHPQEHRLITSIPFSTLESDGSEVTNVALGAAFPKGLFVAMTNGKTFHFYDWRQIQDRINASLK